MLCANRWGPPADEAAFLLCSVHLHNATRTARNGGENNSKRSTYAHDVLVATLRKPSVGS